MIKTLIQIPKYINKSHKTNLVFFFIFALFIPLLESVSVASLGAIVLFVIDIESSINFIPSPYLQELLINMDQTKLILYSSCVFILLLILKNIFIFLYFVFEGRMKRNIGNYHTEIIFKKFINKNYLDLISYNLSSIQSEIMVQSKRISSLIFLITGFAKDMILALIFIISLLIMNYKATIFLIILSLTFSFLFYFLTNKKMKLVGGIIRTLDAELIKVVRATFEGFKIIILFGKKDFFGNKFHTDLSEKTRYELWYFIISKIPRLLLEIVFAFSLVVFLNFFLFNEVNLNTILPFLVFLSLISMRMLPIFTNVNLTIAQMKITQIAVENIINILSDKSGFSFTEKDSSTKIDKKDKFIKIEKIVLKDVYFKYPSKNNKVIKNFSYTFSEGILYALAGRSGSGKSTLVDLMSGVLKPNSGKIFSNTQNIHENIKNWQKKVGYVPQENFLINDSIKNNICFGEKSEEVDMDLLNEAIDQSDLRDFINNLPEKENIILGDRGVNVSGGQKQRIGLARALYQNRSFLILDEATSSVDAQTEDTILKTLHKIKKNRIIIMIAHRQSTIDQCDQIIYLNEGLIKKTN